MKNIQSVNPIWVPSGEESDPLYVNYTLTFPKERYDELTPEAKDSLFHECLKRVFPLYFDARSESFPDILFLKFIWLLTYDSQENQLQMMETYCAMYTIDKILPDWMIELELQDICNGRFRASLQHRTQEDRDIFFIMNSLLVARKEGYHPAWRMTLRKGEIYWIFTEGRKFKHSTAPSREGKVGGENPWPIAAVKASSLFNKIKNIYGSILRFLFHI